MLKRVGRLKKPIPSTDLPDSANRNPPFFKNNPLLAKPKSPIQLPPSRPPKRGVSRSSLNAGRGAVDAAVSGAQTSSQGGLLSVRERRDGTQTTDAKAPFVRLWWVGIKSIEVLALACRVRPSRVVLAPVAGVTSAGGFAGPTGSGTIRRSADNGGYKEIRTPGRARSTPSNHCAGKAGCSPLNLYARVRFFCAYWHTIPRVQRAPGLPCAL